MAATLLHLVGGETCTVPESLSEVSSLMQSGGVVSYPNPTDDGTDPVAVNYNWVTHAEPG